MPQITLKQAHEMHLAGRTKEAEFYYKQILNEHPDEWATLFFLGGIYLERGEEGLAIQMFKRSLEHKPGVMETWNNLGVAYRKRFQNDKARPCFMRALECSENADSYNNLGTIHVNEGSPEQGEKWFRRAIEMQPDFIQAHWNLGLTLLEQGKYREGFEQYAWGLKNKDRLVKHYDCKWWRGESDGTVVAYGEQGIGDEIMFFSQIPDLKRVAKEVILDCHPRLVGLFTRSFGVKCFGTRKIDQDWHWENPVDYKVAAGNLGNFFRRDIADFPGTPYLIAGEEFREKAREKLKQIPQGRLNIGIGWRGGKHKTRTAARSMPLDQMFACFKGLAAKVNLISLQYDDEAQAETHNKGVHHWPEFVAQSADFDMYAGLIAELDLVITVNQSCVHLAGALGQDCWTLTPVRKAWRYYTPDGETIPWYKSVKLIQQKTDMDWTEACERVNAKLKEVVG